MHLKPHEFYGTSRARLDAVRAPSSFALPWRSALLAAFGVALLPFGSLAAESSHGASAVTALAASELPGVEVTAVNPPFEPIDTGTVSVIDRREMDLHLTTSIRDLVRYEPGVSAIGTAGRFGLDSFNIRGFSGNRTYMEIDGVPVADSFGANVAGGGFRAGRNFIDLATIQQVEIIRGPASALYPSNALGGSVIFRTKDPSDYLLSGEKRRTVVKAQYDAIDDSIGTVATLAAGSGPHGLLLSANHRSGHELENMGTVGGTGPSRTRPDPMDYNSASVLAKYVHSAAAGRTDHLTLEASRRRTQVDGLSALSSGSSDDFIPGDFNPGGGNLPGMADDELEDYVPLYHHSQDRSTRVRASAGQWFPALGTHFADTLDWRLYWQQSRTLTDTRTDTEKVERFFQSVPLDQYVTGTKLVASRAWSATGNASHLFSYGLEASRAHARSTLDGYGVHKQTGAIGSTYPQFLPADYPMHLIPESDTDRQAVFAQDRIRLLDGRLTLIPGLRWERYVYRPGNDPLYLDYNPGFEQRDYRKTDLSRKLGLIWRFNPSLEAYANYSDGFRPPLFGELSGAWNKQPIPIVNIAYLPSPDLKSETSRNSEIGIRAHGRAGWFSVAAYRNRYRDMIWSGYALAPDQVPDWAMQIAPNARIQQFFQAVNVPNAWVRGLEFNSQLRLGTFSDGLEKWSLRAAASIASGRLTEAGKSGKSQLNTVDPAKAVVGVVYSADKWGFDVVGTAVRHQRLLSNPAAFRPRGYGLLDVHAHYEPGDQITFTLALNNLTDRKYWDWGNLNGGMLGNLVAGNGLNDAGAGGIPADRLTMAGRTISAAVQFEF